jgi:RNA polymerase sigma factor (sigma-70 family)
MLETIRRAARRAASDPEDADDAVAEILVGFQSDWPNLLGRYREAANRNQADFRVWLSVVARHRAIDFLRARHGRKSLPRAVARLPEWQRELWRLVVERGLDLTEARTALEDRGLWRGDLEALARTAMELRSAAPAPRTRPKISARGGADDELTADPAAGGADPAVSVERNVSQAAFRQILEELAPEERFLIRTYFLERSTAEQVARLNGMRNAEQVYTRVKGLMGRLRSAAERNGLGVGDLAALGDFDWRAALEGGPA